MIIKTTFLFCTGWLFIAINVFGQITMPTCEGENTERWSNCIGTYTSVTGAQYAGVWRNGVLEGRGTYTSFNGERYVGDWKNGRLSIDSFDANHVGDLNNEKRPQSSQTKKNVEDGYSSPVDKTGDAQLRKKCLRLGLASGSDDFNLCLRSK